MLGWLRRLFRRREATYVPVPATITVTHGAGSGPGAVVIHGRGLPDGYVPPSGSLTPPVGLNAVGQPCVAYPRSRENMGIPDLENRFRYHPPQTEQRRQAHETVRSGLLTTAERLDELLPDGREKSLAVTKLEEAMFWANAALARQPDDAGGQ